MGQGGVVQVQMTSLMIDSEMEIAIQGEKRNMPF